jgi:hypothetical protein
LISNVCSDQPTQIQVVIGIDINLLRKEKGGDPDQVRKSQKERFAYEKLVDEVIDLDE